MLKKSEKGETSSSEQAAVVIIELVRYTRVISGTSMYQSCRVAISAAWRRSVVHWWRSVRAGGGWSVRACGAPSRRACLQKLGPLNISREPANDAMDTRWKDADGGNIYTCATVATVNTKAVSDTERDTERDTDSGLTTDSPLYREGE